MQTTKKLRHTGSELYKRALEMARRVAAECHSALHYVSRNTSYSHLG